MCKYRRIHRNIFSSGERFQCQFRERGKEAFSTDCAFGELDEAMSYVSLVVRFLASVDCGQVLDTHQKRAVYICWTPVEVSRDAYFALREVPSEYDQLALTGFNMKTIPQSEVKSKHKVEETFARLRQLHEELNAQLYTRPTERPKIQSPMEAYNILKCFIGSLDHEELWVVLLDTRNRVKRLVGLYKGSINSSQVRVAEVFRQAVVENAPAIVIAHNHPSGDPTPSPDDIAVTRAIFQAGKLLDIDVLDHIVVTGTNFVSLKERGLGFA